MSFPRARCAGTTLIYHWFTEKRNIPLTDGTLSAIYGRKSIVESSISVFDTRLVSDSYRSTTIPRNDFS